MPSISPRPTASLTIRRPVAWLLGLTLLAALLRFSQLGHESFWGDEIISWLQSRQESPGAIVSLMRASGLHPPGHNLLLFATMQLLGDSELALRLPSALAGILAVPLLFRIGRDLFGPAEGLLAAAFLTVLRAPLYYSQEARAYSLMLLFTLVTAWLWLRLLRRLAAGKAPSLPLAAGYVASAIFLAYLHYFGLFWTGLLGLGGAVLCRRRGRALAAWLGLNMIVVLAYLPWVPAMFADYGGEAWIPAPAPGTLPTFFRFLFNDSRSLPLLVAPLLFLLVLHLLAQRPSRRRDSLPPADLLVALWLVVPVGLALVISLVGAPVLSNRNLIIVLPAAYLLLARAIARQPLPPWGRAILGAGYALLFLGHTFWSVQYYSRLQKPQFREAAAYALARADQFPGAVIAGYPGTMFDYYLTRSVPSLAVDLPGGFQEDVAPLEELVAERDAPTVWFLAGGRQPPRTGYIDALESAYTVLDYRKFFQASVWLFGREPPIVVPTEPVLPAPSPPIAAGTVRLRVQPPSGQLWSDPGRPFPIVNDWSPDDQRFFIRKLERDGLWLQFVIRTREDFVFNARFPLGGRTDDRPLELALTWADGVARAYVDGELVRETVGLTLDPAGWDQPLVTPGPARVLEMDVLDRALSAAELSEQAAPP